MSRMVRVILALALAVVLATAVVACGSGDSSTPAAAESSAAPAPTSAAPEPSATLPGGPSNAELAQLYADNCSGCHGADASGGSAPSILGEDDLAEVQAQIENGGGPMPAFSSKLQPGQIALLAQYVVDGLPQ